MAPRASAAAIDAPPHRPRCVLDGAVRPRALQRRAHLAAVLLSSRCTRSIESSLVAHPRSDHTPLQPLLIVPPPPPALPLSPLLFPLSSFVSAMASSRKLQGEIERVLKQITEHMQEFDAIWSDEQRARWRHEQAATAGDRRRQSRCVRWCRLRRRCRSCALLPPRRLRQRMARLARSSVLTRYCFCSYCALHALSTVSRSLHRSSASSSGFDFVWLSSLASLLSLPSSDRAQAKSALSSDSQSEREVRR